VGAPVEPRRFAIALPRPTGALRAPLGGDKRIQPDSHDFRVGQRPPGRLTRLRRRPGPLRDGLVRAWVTAFGVSAPRRESVAAVPAQLAEPIGAGAPRRPADDADAPRLVRVLFGHIAPVKTAGARQAPPARV